MDEAKDEEDLLLGEPPPALIPSNTSSSRPQKQTTKYARLCKMMTPHIALYLFLFAYLLAGASLFAVLEDEADILLQTRKMEKIRRDYDAIISEVIKMSGGNDHRMKQEIRLKTQASLSKLSSQLEGRPFNVLQMDSLPARWTKTSSILYALSILTTTGYASVAPVTVAGQTAAILYGMVGIPLMILAAVDIGRFLSHIVLKLYSRLQIICGAGKKEIMQVVNASSAIKRNKSKSSEEEPAEGESQRLPLLLNATILLLFCCLGGVLYLAAGGNKTFMEAFFVTFNLVANLTMSEMPSDLNHVLTLIYIFVFVTFGVAVLSMCAELAAIELKELFLKIHYFGRKINFKRKPKVDQLDEVEVKELLKMIEEIRRRYPEKLKITSLDILQYMNEAGGNLSERRDTIAFMPQTVEALRFADDQDLEDRNNSRPEETSHSDKLTVRRVQVLQLNDGVHLEEKLRLQIARVISISNKTNQA